MYGIEFTKQATKDLAKILKNYAAPIIEKVKKLSINPYNAELDIKKLKGTDGYKLRIGEYRVIYDVEAGKLIINIIKIQSRGNVYG